MKYAQTNAGCLHMLHERCWQIRWLAEELELLANSLMSVQINQQTCDIASAACPQEVLTQHTEPGITHCSTAWPNTWCLSTKGYWPNT